VQNKYSGNNLRALAYTLKIKDQKALISTILEQLIVFIQTLHFSDFVRGPAVLDGLDAMSFGPLCRGLGWSKEEVQVYLVDVRKCLMDNSVHSWFPFHMSYGRKPENETKDE
jgi:hypothetical protein